MTTIYRVAPGQPVTGVRWQSDEKLVLSAGNELRFLNYNAKAEAQNIEKAKEADYAPQPVLVNAGASKKALATVTSLSLSTVSQRMVATSLTGSVLLFDLETGALLKQVESNPGEAFCAAFCPTAPQFITAGAAGIVHMWGVEGDKIDSIAAGSGASISSGLGAGAAGSGSGSGAAGGDLVMCAVYSPDGGRVAVGHNSGSITVLDTETRAVISRIQAHHLPVRKLAYSYDGLSLMSASDDRTIKVYDASAASTGMGGGAALSSSSYSAGPLICTLSGHLHWVTSLASAPDKHILASGSADKTVRLWDSRKRECLGIIEGHSSTILDMDFNPSGNKVAAGSEGTVGIHSIAGML